MTKDKVESARVRRLVRAKPQRCYHNAYRVIFEIPDYYDADYVEGLVVRFSPLVVEHGWVEKDGGIIDPTLRHDDVTYFPGLRFKGQRGLAEAMRVPKPEGTTEDFPILYRFGFGGIDSPEFRAALAAAYHHVGCHELARQYEYYSPDFATESSAV